MNKYYLFTASLCIFVILLIIICFSIIGTPFEQKAISLDKQRISAIQNIREQIQIYANSKGLPSSLSQISELNSSSYSNILKDPENSKPYDYQKLSETNYQICGTFSADSDKQDSYTLQNFLIKNSVYKKGYNCFNFALQLQNSYLTPPTLTPTPLVTKTFVQTSATPTPTPVTPTVINASEINLTLRYSPSGKTVIASFTNPGNLTSAQYTLTYTASGVARGSIGFFDLNIDPATKEIVLGRCASVCAYDQNVTDLKIVVTFAQTGGGSRQATAYLSQ